MPSSAPTRMCWFLVSGWTQLAVQVIFRGHPLNTLEKQAPMWTLGVGGSPLEVALGGEVARFCEEVRSRRRGGACGDELPFWRACERGSCARLSDSERCRPRGEPEMLRIFSAAAAETSELWNVFHKKLFNYLLHLRPLRNSSTIKAYLWSWRSPPGERQLVILTSIVADAEGGGVMVHLVPGVLPTQSSHAVASEIVHSSEIIQLRYLDILKAKFHALSRFIEDRTLWIPIFKINLWIRILDY